MDSCIVDHIVGDDTSCGIRGVYKSIVDATIDLNSIVIQQIFRLV